MRALAVLVAGLLLAGVARATTVTFPLLVDYPVLAAALTEQLHPDPDGVAVFWGRRGSCRFFTLRDLHLARAANGLVRLSARGSARAGFSLLGFCIAPASWEGYLETIATPEIGADWQLRLRSLNSHLYDAEWRRTTVASRVWDAVKAPVEDQFRDFAFDLGPPIDEVKALLRASAAPARARPVLAALETIRPLTLEAAEDGVLVPVAMDLPPSEVPSSAPEPALAPADPAVWQAAVEAWDAFLVFVIKDLGALDADVEVRQALLDVLLNSRARLLSVIAGGPQPGVDPVRELFLDTWERLRGIVHQSAARGALRERALRYLAFLAAGDALAALDAAGPSLGLEISAEGLRRLALVLEPDFIGDPVAYAEIPDETLRRLFDFHDPAATLPPPEAPPPPDGSWWFGPKAAHAAPPTTEELGALARRLDRWIPRDEELPEYRDAVGRLLALIAERTAATNAIGDRFATLYGHLVPTTAWQESCWRQFVERSGKVTYLLSTSGDVGIMQVNRRVWRGFFDLRKLEWDIAYNAGAGAEILAQLLVRYGAREANARLEDAARATYAAYNGGPDAYRRYRLGKIPRRLRAIDQAFWDKFQAMAAGRALDFVLCTESWGSPARTRLSIAPLGSTPKCCISSRSSSATETMSARHASIASRPRASFV